MCLAIAENQQELINKYFGDKKERVFWKTVEYESLINSYNIVIYTIHRYVTGINKSNRLCKELTQEELCDKRINFGIHVHTNKLVAIEDSKLGFKKYLVIPVICRKSNLIAFGTNQDAVFTQVRFRKRDYKAALRK